MKAKSLFDVGNLVAAIGEMNQEVKAHPADVLRRLFLFELLIFAGDYERAERQLDVISQQDQTVATKGLMHRDLLKAEKARGRLFSEGLRPTFLLDAPPYARLYLEAIDHLRAGKASEARKSLEEAEDLRPAFSGRFNGEPFEDVVDVHPFIGACLEIIVNGSYVWLPLTQLRRLQMPAPKTVFDLLWRAATLEANDGSVGSVFIPVLYPGSHEHPDEKVKLGKRTDWKTIDDELELVVGRREFFIDEQTRGLLEMRELELDPESTAGE